MSPQEWDVQFFGQVKMVGSKFAPQLLIAEQKFRRIVEYHNKKYMVTAWTPPDGSAYVEAEPIYDGSRSKDDSTMSPYGTLFERTNETCKEKIEKTVPCEVDQGDDLASPHGPGPSRELVSEGRIERNDRAAAVEMIGATAPERRSAFAREIWAKRRERAGEVPF